MSALMSIAPILRWIMGMVGLAALFIILFFVYALVLEIRDGRWEKKKKKKAKGDLGDLDDYRPLLQAASLGYQYQMLNASQSVNETPKGPLVIPPPEPPKWPCYAANTNTVSDYINELHELILDLQDQIDELSKDK